MFVFHLLGQSEQYCRAHFIRMIGQKKGETAFIHCIVLNNNQAEEYLIHDSNLYRPSRRSNW